MTARQRWKGALVAAFAFMAGVAHAETPPVLSAAEKAGGNSRPLAVLAPNGLNSSIELGRIASNGNGGGLIGMIIIDAMDDNREVMTDHATQKAQATIAPLIASLKGMDLASLALQTSVAIAGHGTLFSPAATALVPSDAAPSPKSLLVGHPSNQYGITAYRVEMAPDFTHLRVIASIAVADAKSDASLSELTVTSIVELRQRAYDHDANVRRWQGRDGQVARDAVVAGFRRLETVVPAALALDSASFAARTDKRKVAPVFAAGFFGPEFMRDQTGVVIWAKGKGLVAVQPATD